MARLKVFVSSTFYDLKHIRSSMQNFIEGMGYEAVLFERGNVHYSPDTPQDISCYNEIKNANIFVLIVGGRYGSESTTNSNKSTGNVTENSHFQSITKEEFRHAFEKRIPIYVLIDQTVFDEYRTFECNKENKKVNYYSVDSPQVFEFINHIYGLPHNNPVHPFQNFSDIESWLKEQWSGFFHELLLRRTAEKELETLSSKVAELSEINTTLKTYLETLLRNETNNDVKNIVAFENKRLEDIRDRQHIRELEEIPFIRDLIHYVNIPTEVILNHLYSSRNPEDFYRKILGSEAEGIRKKLPSEHIFIEMIEPYFRTAKLIAERQYSRKSQRFSSQTLTPHSVKKSSNNNN